MTNIYVASSWRNPWYGEAVRALRAWDFQVYDWRATGGTFAGRAPSQTWGAALLADPASVAKFEMDMAAMREAAACVLVEPAGRSAHLEAGWFVGQGRPLYVWLPEPIEPELMLLTASLITPNLADIITRLRWERETRDWGKA